MVVPMGLNGITLRRMRWMGQVAQVWEKRNTYMGKARRKETNRKKEMHNIQMDLGRQDGFVWTGLLAALLPENKRLGWPRNRPGRREEETTGTLAGLGSCALRRPAHRQSLQWQEVEVRNSSRSLTVYTRVYIYDFVTPPNL
jgi:hypothetical protein